MKKSSFEICRLVLLRCGIEKYEGQTLKITDIGYKIDSKMGVFDFSGGQINFFLQFNAM